ncbi:MAG: hypothetical protein JRH03_10445, partial [Deltaproteobacteria bacterium]|nr:hypothetical protein [Deltaproteobacteria bacterium]
LLKKKRFALTLSGFIRSAIIAGLVATGLLLVIYNFSGVAFPMWAAATLLVAHMTLAVALIVTGLIVIIRKMPWTVPN